MQALSERRLLRLNHEQIYVRAARPKLGGKSPYPVDEVKVWVGSENFGVQPEGDCSLNEITQRKTVTAGDKLPANAGRGFPVCKAELDVADAAEERGDILGIPLPRNSLENLGNDGADQRGAIFIEQTVHGLLLRRLRTVEERNPNTGINENDAHPSRPSRDRASFLP